MCRRTGARNGTSAIIGADAADARYVPTGHLVFLRRGMLFAVPFDADRLEVRGTPVVVLDTVAQALTASGSGDLTGAGQFAISTTGTLAWVPGPVVPYPDRALVSVDRRGQVSPLTAAHPGPGPRTQVSIDGGSAPAWHKNGRELFFVSPADEAGRRRMMVADFEPASPGRTSTPRPLFEFGRELAFSWAPVHSYDVAPDGQRFYVRQDRPPPPLPPVTHINLILNWFEELKAKVPTGR